MAEVNECRNKTTILVSICSTCQKSKAKYRCPGCFKASCSIACVNKHKEEIGCDGRRNKTAFVKLGDFTEHHLMSDYLFLEDAERNIGAVTGHESAFAHLRCSSKVNDKLKSAARRRKVNLLLSPYLSTRRKSNSTYCSFRNMHANTLFWHLVWMFQGERLVTTRVDENKLLKDMLESVLLRDSNSEGHRASFTKTKSMCDFVERQTKTGEEFVVLMKAEHLVGEMFYRLDSQKSFHENFSGKTVVEHPVLYIVTKEEMSNLTVIT